MDFVFTVCDETAELACPTWPGNPMVGHWGVADPATFEGTPAQKAANYASILRQIRTRIELFLALPMHALDQLAIKSQIDEIGRTAN